MKRFLLSLMKENTMSTIALKNLWSYIESMGLSNRNKDWLAGKIIESKTRSVEEDMHIFDCFDGNWGGDKDSHEIADELYNNRKGYPQQVCCI